MQMFTEEQQEIRELVCNLSLDMAIDSFVNVYCLPDQKYLFSIYVNMKERLRAKELNYKEALAKIEELKKEFLK